MEYSQLWLDYRPLKAPPTYLRRICPQVESTPGRAALLELLRGFTALAGGVPAFLEQPEGPCLLIQEQADPGEGYQISQADGVVTLTGGPRGLVYGAFQLLRSLSLGQPTPLGADAPRYPIRMLDHWDNADGMIERGYSGRSFFFRDGQLQADERTMDYARLIASCGLNGACVNNVNVRGAATRLLEEAAFPALRALAGQFQEYGLTLWLSVNFAAPMELGGLPTADPLDELVQSWWRRAAEALFAAVPGLGGFLVKADSEGRPGPFTYGRSHAQGANMLAEAVRPFGGKILWRCFVYNCTQDWRDSVTDRARAQYDSFAPLDGQFADNVYLQIKNGPVDFQVREPVSPLLGSLEKTNRLLEFQIAQEYTGQQRHVCYLIPWFKQVLDFSFHPQETVADRLQAICAVSNTGDDPNWTGHDLAAANLYGFGRLSWDPTLDPADLAREWSQLTYGPDERVTAAVTDILMASWPAYEQYTVPLGLGWMCVPGVHYGPSPDGYEYDRWGTYHRATCREIGVERGPGGTGFSEQYPAPLNALYGDARTCPEELLLFFHRLPYDFPLKSGKTLIQHVYDSHFDGYEAAEQMAWRWSPLQGLVPEPVFRRVTERFDEQLRSAREWRDVINAWFYRRTLIPDQQNRTIY